MKSESWREKQDVMEMTQEEFEAFVDHVCGELDK